MTKDDDHPAASGGAPSRRGLPGHGRKTAPIGTPVQKFPLEIPAAAPPPVTPMPVAPVRSDRPPSSSQNTLSSPRTVGGHTARLLRGERLDDDEPASIDPSRGARPRVQDRSARARPPIEEDEETLSQRSGKAKAEADAARGGTLRMDAVDAPASVRAAPAPAAGRKAPPVVTPPLSPEPVSEDPPSTARGGSARDFHDVPVYSAKPAPVVAHPAAAPVAPPVAASPAPPVVSSTPMGEITITASEFESTAVPQEAIESRWPFAFALGAVSLAVGSLLPLPFRQYIVPDRGPAAGTSAPAVSAAPVVAAPDLLRTATPLPRTATVAPPPSLTTPTIGVAPPATSAVRPLPFGTVKPRPTSTTPKDVF